MSNLPLGRMGEQVAANYLVAQGYEILDSNYYNTRGYRVGEIDLVAKEPEGMLVFVEVKSRVGTRDTVVPEENITPRKIRRITKAAQHYLYRNKMPDAWWRIDSVAVIFDMQRKKLDIRHIKAIRL